MISQGRFLWLIHAIYPAVGSCHPPGLQAMPAKTAIRIAICRHTIAMPMLQLGDENPVSDNNPVQNNAPCRPGFKQWGLNQTRSRAALSRPRPAPSLA